MAPAGTCNLRAILRTTLALVDYFGDTEKHDAAMLIELKRSLARAIGELDSASKLDGPPLRAGAGYFANGRSN